ncbi:di-heme oxidoredictase family protein [Rhizobium sp. SSA_523]|uniref:di-heme oxidoreductase family protein n=1 Tax=Rhizobium sp. SSA_523 TaxID=2952477 RepID=UPI002091A76A|nr:di-heme oxidoredictase family protein [Rhizobium sp. SSA_523]MCO5732715.1 thiol oxidoreductase [Rhizobium sp. SSA_523]WKC23661.1 di-heme oxidoredictase family protein [Rhizobium sp. SSA_523]
MRTHPLAMLLLCALAGAGLLVPALGGETLPLRRSDLPEHDRARVAAVTRPTQDFTKPEAFEAMSGGAATSTAAANGNAFSHFSANLSFAEEERFKLGNALFTKLWVAAPSSTQASDGLGPLYNARACQSCHIMDGRGHPPEGGKDRISMFLRLARPARTPDEQASLSRHEVLNFPDATYGEQLQDLAVPGLAAEGEMVITYAEVPVVLADGTTLSLRKPDYRVAELAYGPLEPDTTLSPRIAPPMLGMGLIEAIAEADILALADPDDRNGDGISGRAALTRDHRTGDLALGRFGFKAQNASVRDQVAAAFSGDMGLSTPDRPDPYGDCSKTEHDCRSLANGVQERLGDSEAPDTVMDLVTFYSKNLAVPARRNVSEPHVLAGKNLFYSLGCASCHVPKFVTRRDADDQAQSFQLIWPYSDFLLHDMGQGLADGQSVGSANGQEWRTPPLWGIGLTSHGNGHTFFLHDGRARNLTEAVLWHGGEAEAARNAFAASPPEDRAALMAFLESL